MSDETSLGALLEDLQHASFVPVLLVPALAVVTPLSGIPLFSSTCGVLIALVAAQARFGRKVLWLPGWITKRKIPPGGLRKAVVNLRKPAEWFDNHTHPRIRFLVSPPFDRIIYFVCMLCGMAMPPLELVPFSSSVLGALVAILSLTLLVRDGVFALAAIALIGVVVGFVFYAI